MSAQLRRLMLKNAVTRFSASGLVSVLQLRKTCDSLRSARSTLTERKVLKMALSALRRSASDTEKNRAICAAGKSVVSDHFCASSRAAAA